MDYSIDKDEFWQICATDAAAAGTYTEDPRSPSDFLDQYVVTDGADSGSLGANFFMPLQVGQGEDDFSPPTSSVTEAITSASSTNGSAADVSRTTSNFSVEETLKAISLAETTHYQPLRGRLPERASGTDSETTHHAVLGPLNSDDVEQRRRLLSGRRGQEQAAGGSITDSELLQLEGLSVNSPRKLGPRQTSGPSVPPTPPPLQDYVPTTTAYDIAGITANIDLDQLAQNTRNHKSSRWLETKYSNLKKAVGGLVRGPQQQQQQQHQQQQPPPPQQQQQQHPSTAPIPQTMTPSHVESAKKATRRLASESQAAPFNWDSLPISPPLTDSNNLQPSDAATFGNGYLDDPFFDPAASFTHAVGLAPAAQIIGMGNVQNCNNPNTPSHTPDMETDHAMDDELTKFFTPSHTWNLDNSFGSTTGMDTSFGSVSWGFDPLSDSGSNLDWPAAPADDSHTSTRNHHNLTIQVPPPYVQDNRHHHAPLSDDLATSGLMIHMPQPRTPATAPLLSSSVPPMHHPQPPQQQQQHIPQYPFPEQTTPQHNMHSFRGPYTDHGHYGGTQRRPKPRAPSSGARYHQMGPAGPASISPRKTRQPSCSSSSPSPTPGGRRSRSAGRRASLTHRASASDITTVPTTTTDTQTHAVRKQRSMSSWRRQKRTTSTSSSADGSGGGGGGGVGGGGGGGFVNYTPNDHGVLMTGVAPSGSSKTKARREKEAIERQRKLLAEVGVDVDRLKQEGIVI
ncbi:hypothetical protein J7T55_009347 [Diaporthe amygdali]|uniref:uncharacterized protein n=1 Tax=Phomopsis amygdali TaxID=1214568 RepID=UPI0022FE5115|nr:uncharacterized protein J7T55_009347 [Diaporthe amygdali]KAJ0107383.1 hypothetical protein J7T55_009347 [Diaporthe amygdali]